MAGKRKTRSSNGARSGEKLLREDEKASNLKVKRENTERTISSKTNQNNNSIDTRKNSSRKETNVVLFALPKLVKGTLRKRPSAAIKSPYVADVDVHTQSGDVSVLAHCPCLDVSNR